MAPARFLVAVSAVVAGCTHHRPLADVSEVSGEIVRVETTRGEKLTAYVQASPQDGNIVLRPQNGNDIPDSSVVSVVDIRRGRGAYEGFLIAGGAGLVVGAIAGLSAGDDNCHDYCILNLSAEDKAALFGGYLGIVGGAIGLVIGAAVGSHYVYSNETSMTARIRPLGPPGSAAGLSVAF